MMIVVVVVILNCVSSTQFHESRLHKMIFGPNRLENTFADTSCNVSNWRSSPSLVPASCLYYVDDPEAEYSAMVRPKRNVTESLGKGQIFVLSNCMKLDWTLWRCSTESSCKASCIIAWEGAVHDFSPGHKVRWHIFRIIRVFSIYWTDEFISWHPDMHGGIKSIIVPADTVWKPDIELYNSLFEEFRSVYDADISISHDG